MKESLYLSKCLTDLNRLWSIFNLLSAFLAGVFFFEGVGGICKQAEEATTRAEHNMWKYTQISNKLVAKGVTE